MSPALAPESKVTSSKSGVSPALAPESKVTLSKSGVRILIAAGSSGGHIFPALSLLEILRARHSRVRTLLVLPRKNLKNNISAEFEVRYISTRNINFKLSWQNVISLFSFIKGSFESFFLLLEFKPDIVVGFGTLNCLPLVVLAWLLRIKTLIHEQNVIPGRANLLLAKICDRIAVSFSQTKDYLGPQRHKAVLTGNPLRRHLQRVEREEAGRFFGFSGDKFTILVAGGSQASRSINTGFLKAISDIAAVQQASLRAPLSSSLRAPQGRSNPLRVIHITGDEDYALLDSAYRDLGIEAKLFTFLGEMQYAYSIADLVVCRSGATTIAELIYFALPAIIIPYPYAYKHQAANSRVLERKGAALVINDADLGGDRLKMELQGILDNPDKLRLMRSAFDCFDKLEAPSLLMQEVLSLNG